MFQSARIKLTIWYVLIIAIITVFFSVAAYRGFALEIERTLGRSRVYVQQTPGNFPQFYLRRPDPEAVQEARERILLRIIGIDTIIIILSGVAGYFLAGITLKPIKKMVDEQNRFVADASHELRTPLTAARTSLEVGLRDKKLSLPESKELLQSTLEDVTTIQALADSLLLLAQFEHQNVKSVHKPVLIESILENAKNKVKKLAAKKNIEINLSYGSYSVFGNEDSLTELFVILFDNAVKYSEKNAGPIDVLTVRTDGSLKISVSDRGIGIVESDLPHIFDRFYRADKSRTRTKSSGYGLGLSIAKKIIEEHDGNISVKKNKEKGTMFTVTLPVKKS